MKLKVTTTVEFEYEVEEDDYIDGVLEAEKLAITEDPSLLAGIMASGESDPKIKRLLITEVP